MTSTSGTSDVIGENLGTGAQVYKEKFQNKLLFRTLKTSGSYLSHIVTDTEITIQLSGVQGEISEGTINQFYAWDKSWKKVKFNGLDDVTPFTSGDIGKFVKVNASGTGLDYGTVTEPDLSGYVTLGTVQTITNLKFFNGLALGVRTSGAGDVLFLSGNARVTTSPFAGTLKMADLEANRTWTLPNASGTLALFTDIPTTYTHPTGFTNQPTTALTGASVISQITVNDNGHVTGVSTRELSLVTDFNSLTDVTPYTNVDALKFVRVNGTGTGLIYETIDLGSGYVTLGTVQSITGKKTFSAGAFAMKGTSTGVTTFTTANTSSDNYTITYPATTGTVALLSNIPSIPAATWTTLGTTIIKSSVNNVFIGQLLAGASEGYPTLKIMSDPGDSNIGGAFVIRSFIYDTSGATLHFRVSGNGVAQAGTEVRIGGLNTTSLRLNVNPTLSFFYPDSDARRIALRLNNKPTENLIFNLPYVYGTSGQALTTDGTGNMIWADVSTNAPPVFTNTVNGLVPAPNRTEGWTAGTRFLADDATWKEVTGGGTTTSLSIVDGTARTGALILAAGNGVTIGNTSLTFTVSHADTSSQTSVSNSEATFIQGITLDTFGHITNISSASISSLLHSEVTLDTSLRYLTLSGQQIIVGKVSVSDLDTGGTASATTFLNGEGDWVVPSGTGSGISDVSSGNLWVRDYNGGSQRWIAHVPVVQTGIRLGALGAVRTGTLTLTYTSGGVLITESPDGTFILAHDNTSNISDISNSGVSYIQGLTFDGFGHVLTTTSTTIRTFTSSQTGLVPIVGIADDKFLRGDGTWATVSSGTTHWQGDTNGIKLVTDTNNVGIGVSSSPDCKTSIFSNNLLYTLQVTNGNPTGTIHAIRAIISSAQTTAVAIYVNGNKGTGIYSTVSGTGQGIAAYSENGYSVYAKVTGTGAGVYATAVSGIGVLGTSSEFYGGYFTSASGYGLFAMSNDYDKAAYFEGTITVHQGYVQFGTLGTNTPRIGFIGGNFVIQKWNNTAWVTVHTITL
jgi:hypothetical protein